MHVIQNSSLQIAALEKNVTKSTKEEQDKKEETKKEEDKKENLNKDCYSSSTEITPTDTAPTDAPLINKTVRFTLTYLNSIFKIKFVIYSEC